MLDPFRSTFLDLLEFLFFVSLLEVERLIKLGLELAPALVQESSEEFVHIVVHVQESLRVLSPEVA